MVVGFHQVMSVYLSHYEANDDTNLLNWDATKHSVK